MKRIVAIIFVSLTLATLFVCIKYYTFGHVMTKANFGMRAICVQDNIKDLYLGSSMFRQGIDCRDLGDSTYLLSYSSNRPFMEALQLDYMLSNGAKFERLIIDMYPYSIARMAGLSDVKMIMDGDVNFTIDVYKSMHRSGVPITKLYDMLVLQNNEILLTLPISFPLMNDRYERGSNTSVLHGRTPSYLEQLEPHEIERESMTPIQAEGLDKIIKICRDKDIELVFLETPKYEKINSDRVYIKLMKEFAQFLSDKNVQMILFEKTMHSVSDVVNPSLVKSYDFNDDNALYYRDLYHISYEGRKELSRKILDILNSR